MQNTRIKTVDGALVLPIPDDIVQALGMREGLEVYLDVDQRHRRMIAMLRETSPPDAEDEFVERVTQFVDAFGEALVSMDGKAR